jgi:hypothetical protein
MRFEDYRSIHYILKFIVFGRRGIFPEADQTSKALFFCNTPLDESYSIGIKKIDCNIYGVKRIIFKQGRSSIS